ncbi:MAG: hypothetical protein M9894_18680 [Planctomycetes bacterium]|nr:hypothetical protein [Planctomycetota bacterium]
MAPTPRVLALLALAAALQGCASPCEGFNPYREYKRQPEKGNSDKPAVDVAPGRFYLACYVARAEDDGFAKQAIDKALQESGGGGVTQVSGEERTGLLRRFAHATGGPYWDSPQSAGLRLRVGQYRVVFDAASLNLASDFDVEWTAGPDGQNQPLVLPVNTDGSHVTLVHNGRTEYELIFDGEKVTERGGLLVPSGYDKPSGARRFQPVPFRLKFGARGQGGLVQAGEEIRIEPKAEDVKVIDDPKLLLFEVNGFAGDMSAFLCHLLSRDLKVGQSDDDPNAPIVSFTMRQTDVWLNATVGKGAAAMTLKADWTVFNAADRASSLQVEVPGVGTFSESDDAGRGHTLTQRFDGVNLIIEFSVQLDPSKRPEGEFVTFSYRIGGSGPESRERVRHSLAAPK